MAKTELLLGSWTAIDPKELRIILDESVGGPGQYDDKGVNPTKFFLPLARDSCQVVLTYRDAAITSIEPGPAFDAGEWKKISAQIDALLAGSLVIGREFSFSSFRVNGSWRGDRSGLQIVPPGQDVPTARIEASQHPFVLEFPIRRHESRAVTNYRRLREHRRFTLLLNLLLTGHTQVQPFRAIRGVWAIGDDGQSHWAQRRFLAGLNTIVADELSPTAGNRLIEVDPAAYHGLVGHDGQGLRLPTGLDDDICRYQRLSQDNVAKFDRALYWFEMASQFWDLSASASFTALVSAIESLTGRGEAYNYECPVCGRQGLHEVPGATRRFRDFLEKYVPGEATAKARNEMYSVRSQIVHGGNLMQLDQGRDFGWDPPWWEQRELHDHLWPLTRSALCGWLREPSRTDVHRAASTEDPDEHGTL